MNGARALFGWSSGGGQLLLGFVLWANWLGDSVGMAQSEPAVIRGPYLQRGTPTNIVIRWRTDLPTDSLVAFGLDADMLDRSVTDVALTNEHEVVVSGLEPDTTYYYGVGSTNGLLASGPDYWFATAPSGAKPVRIWAIGDSGFAYEPSRMMLDNYLEWHRTQRTDIWLLLGDNAYIVGSDENYQTALFVPYRDLLRQTVVWPALGNHETYAPYPDGHLAFQDIFTLPQQGEAGGVPSGSEFYYSFNYANVHLICLDSETQEIRPGMPMLRWLEADLEANTNEWVIAYWHGAPYSKGTHDSDYLPDTTSQMTPMRSYAVPILEAYGVDLVLAGHSHNYERSYLLAGHYGFSHTLRPSMIRDPGDGREDGEGPYRKAGRGPMARLGTVYVVNGAAGEFSFVSFPPWLWHPAMVFSETVNGSVLIDINGPRLDLRFLRFTGLVDDYFTILKEDRENAFELVDQRMEDGRLTLWWISKPRTVYQVQFTGDLNGNQWQPVSDGIPTHGALTSWTNSAALPPKPGFYRVREISD